MLRNEESGGSVGRPRSRGRRITVSVLAGILALGVVSTELMIWRTYIRTSETSETFNQASYRTTTLVNVQRQYFLVERAIFELVADGDRARFWLERALLDRQITIVRSWSGAETLSVLDEIDALLAKVDDTVRSVGPSENVESVLPVLRPKLSALEVKIKETYDNQEAEYFEVYQATLDAKKGSQKAIVLLGGAVIVLGALLTVIVMRANRNDLRRAYRALTGEMHERRRAEQALSLSEARFRSLAQNASDAICIVDRGGRLSYQSPSVERILGRRFGPGQEGETLFEEIHEQDRDDFHAAFDSAAATPEGIGLVPCRIRHQDGGWRWMETIISNRLHDEAVAGFVINYRDVTERHGLEEKLTYQAFHDSMTGLANRALFLDRLEQSVVQAQRHDWPLGILFIDLDDFKYVNDSLGHSIGDEVLQSVARRLRVCLRSSDTVARFGGDEFAVLLDGPTTREDAIRAADRVIEKLARPIQVREVQVSTRACIGIALSSAKELDAGRLLRHADAAMYAAKQSGKGRREVFDETQHVSVLNRMKREEELRIGIERGEFELHYQPMIDLASGSVYGAEALVRWAHPDRGLLPPSEFITLAEETELIHPLARWILDTSLAQASEWRRSGDKPDFTLSVNLSVKQLLAHGIVQQVDEALQRSGFPSENLVLEITEGLLLQENDERLQTLDALKALGLRIAIDDFGTGYSSLSYLRRLPIDILKIDRAFTCEISGGPEAAALAQAIVQIGSTMGLVTIAEGIETHAQREKLIAMGCALGQGFLFSKPVPAEDFQVSFGELGSATEVRPMATL